MDFEQIRKYTEDFRILRLSFDSSLRAAEDILSGIDARIEAEREADAEREVAGVAPAGRLHGPTEPERVAFEAAVADAGDAIIGLHELSVNMKVAAYEIKAALDELTAKLAVCPTVCEAQVGKIVERFQGNYGGGKGERK